LGRTWYKRAFDGADLDMDFGKEKGGYFPELQIPNL
jgi:hypothetical protein